MTNVIKSFLWIDRRTCFVRGAKMTGNITNWLKSEISDSTIKIIQQLVKETGHKSFDLLIPSWFLVSGITTFDGDVSFQIAPGLNVVFAASHHGKTTFLNSLFFTLSNSFDLPTRRISYLSTRIANKSRQIILRTHLLSKIYGKIEISKTITHGGKIKNVTIQKLSRNVERVLSSNSTDESKITEKKLLESGHFNNWKEFANFYSIFFFGEFPQHLLDEKYRGMNSSAFLRKFWHEVSGNHKARKILDHLDFLIRTKTRRLNEHKKTHEILKRFVDNTSSKAIVVNEPSDEIISERINQLEKKLKQLTRERQQQADDNKNHLDELINNKLQIQEEINRIESELTRYKRLDGNQKVYELFCPLCEDNLPKKIILRRIEEDTCPLCGSGSLYVDVSVILDLEDEKLRLLDQLSIIENKLQDFFQKRTDRSLDIEEQILNIKSQLEALTIQKNSLSEKKHWKNMVNQIEQKTASITPLSKEVTELKKAKKIIQEEYDKNILNITRSLNRRFIQLQSALFNNILVQIDDHFKTKTLKHNTFTDFSNTERKLLEICFRLAICDTLFTQCSKPSFLILETPEQDLDQTYKDLLAEMLASYHETFNLNQELALRLIISIVDGDFLRNLNAKTNSASEINVLPLHKYSTTTTERQQALLTTFFNGQSNQ